MADFAGECTPRRISTGSPVWGVAYFAVGTTIRRHIRAVSFMWASRRGEMLSNKSFIAMQRDFHAKTSTVAMICMDACTLLLKTLLNAVCVSYTFLLFGF